MEVIQIVLQVSILIIGFYIAFFKSYFTEKGKNLATKEDINEITSMVENVKNQIHFSTQSKFDLRIEERKSLVDHYEKYNFWLRTIIGIYLGGINEDNKDRLEEFRNRMDASRLDYDLSLGRMELFVSNEELSDLLPVLKTKTLELEHIVVDKISDLRFAILKMELKILETPAEQSKIFSEYASVKTKIINSLNCERKEKYKELLKLDRKFQIIVYNHLNGLIELR